MAWLTRLTRLFIYDAYLFNSMYYFFDKPID